MDNLIYLLNYIIYIETSNVVSNSFKTVNSIASGEFIEKYKENTKKEINKYFFINLGLHSLIIILTGSFFYFR
jgi:hypothetical protein